MNDDGLVHLLRCPLDPHRAAMLRDDGTHLSCTRCAVRFAVREGFPNLIPDDAQLPADCPSVERLPCRRRP